MGEDPQFPPIPDVGSNVLGKKKRLEPREITVVKCRQCNEEIVREFKPGDHVFKLIENKECPKCHKNNTLEITEIYSEWYDPKKQEKSKK